MICGLAPSNVSIGACVSITFTVRVTGVALFPVESIAVYVTVYVPTTAVLTVEVLIVIKRFVS